MLHRPPEGCINRSGSLPAPLSAKPLRRSVTVTAVRVVRSMRVRRSNTTSRNALASPVSAQTMSAESHATKTATSMIANSA
jgi:hypothetical protein